MVYAVEYSYGGIQLLNHHEISFTKSSNDCNKTKTSNDYFFFHLSHQQATEYL